MDNQIKNTFDAYKYDLQENDLPPISFHQPTTTQQKQYVYKYSQGTNICRMNTFTEIQQSPQPVEKVIENSDETMLEHKQENNKVERSCSENSMECEIEKKQKNMIQTDGKLNGNIIHNTVNSNTNNSNGNIIQNEKENGIQTQKNEIVHQMKSQNNQFENKNIQIKSNGNPIQNAINQQIQIANQTSQNQMKQQKSKEKINQSMYNILPTVVQTPTQTTNSNQYSISNSIFNQPNQKDQNGTTTTNKMKVTTPQAIQKGTTVTSTTQNAKITKEKKPTKLRFQTCDKKQRPLIPIKSTKPMIDPNMTKRREMIRGLRDLQRKCLFTQTKVISSKNEMNATTFLRDMNDYCYRNDFFRCEMNEKQEVIVSCEIFGERKMNVIFDMNEKNYENWNFPKPRMSDGKEICDKNMLDKMKKQPSVEIFMNELFRIITVCCSKY